MPAPIQHGTAPGRTHALGSPAPAPHPLDRSAHRAGSAAFPRGRKTKKPTRGLAFSGGAPGRIRTSDPQVRSLVLYPTELRAQKRNYAEPLGARQRKISDSVQVCRVSPQVAETEGFEPSMELLTPYSLSRGAPSASRASLRGAQRITALRIGGKHFYQLASALRSCSEVPSPRWMRW